jgi:hypothetical protein
VSHDVFVVDPAPALDVGAVFVAPANLGVVVELKFAIAAIEFVGDLAEDLIVGTWT